MQPLRLFIALDIPLSIQQALQFKVVKIRKILGETSIRWVAIQNIHLTLKFLGNVPPENTSVLKEILEREALSSSPFEIYMTSFGAFPNFQRPRVLVIKVQAPAELDALQHRIDSATAKAGYESESKPFSPHLTIGRVRDHIPASEISKIGKAFSELQIDSPVPCSVDSVHLYQSDLKPGGAVYTKLFSAPLTNRSRSL